MIFLISRRLQKIHILNVKQTCEYGLIIIEYTFLYAKCKTNYCVLLFLDDIAIMIHYFLHAISLAKISLLNSHDEIILENAVLYFMLRKVPCLA